VSILVSVEEVGIADGVMWWGGVDRYEVRSERTFKGKMSSQCDHRHAGVSGDARRELWG
jgi:hypothetical protein